MGFDDIVTTGLAALFGGALLWGVVTGLVMDEDNLRGAQTMFRSVTVSCACWFVASVIAAPRGCRRR